MARETTKGNDPFEIDALRRLMELMEKHDVREFKLQKGDARYVLRRGPQEAATAIPAPVYAPPPATVSTPATTTVASASGSTQSTPAGGDEGHLTIKSPTVGTFYQSPTPGDPPFVKTGDTVKADTVVCIIEAMKVFNQIPAGLAGTVTKVLLNDGDAVEFGQPMFLVKPN